MIELPLDNIVRIEENLLIYKDEQGAEKSLDLSECADNYRRMQELFIGDMGLCCVGERFFDIYTYYEFYAQEQIRFYTEIKRKMFDGKFGIKPFLHKGKYKKFEKIEQMLNEAGYTTVLIM